MPSLPHAALGLVCALALSACATLTRGTDEAYVIQSDPSGAVAHLSTGEVCTTPCTLTKKHNDSFTVTFEKDGFEPTEVEVTNKACQAGTVALTGNLLLIGSVVWAGVDKMTGATRALTPNPCRVKLIRLRPEEQAPSVPIQKAETPKPTSRPSS